MWFRGHSGEEGEPFNFSRSAFRGDNLAKNVRGYLARNQLEKRLPICQPAEPTTAACSRTNNMSEVGVNWVL